MLSGSEDDDLLDARIFAHIHLDQRLVGSHLQGAAFSATTRYVLHALEKMLVVEEDVALKDVLENVRKEFLLLVAAENQIKEARGKLVAINTNKMIYSLLSLKQQLIKPIAEKMVAQLMDNGKLLIPGGWVGAFEGVPGHAMIYQFEKKSDGKLRFIVYNTGDGINAHLQESWVKDKYSPFKVYEMPEMPAPEALVNFILELCTPQIVPKLQKLWNRGYPDTVNKAWDNDRQYDGNRIYGDVIARVRLLGANEINPTEYSHITTQGQLSGTCAMRVLMPLLRVEMGKVSFQKFQYRFQLLSIEEYFAKAKDERAKVHIVVASRKLAKKINKLRLRQVIDENEAKTVLGKLERIQQDSSETMHGEVQEKTEQSIEIENINRQIAKTVIGNKIEIPTSSGEIQARKKEIKMPRHRDYSDEPFEFLKKCYEVSMENFHEGYYESLVDKIEKVFMDYNIKDLAGMAEYWKNLSQRDSKDALKYLQCILRIYAKCCSTINPEYNARQAITAKIGMLVVYSIGNCFYDNDQEFKKLMAICVRGGIKNGIYEVTLDPKLDEKLEDVKRITGELQGLGSSFYGGIEDYDAVFFSKYINNQSDRDMIAHYSEKHTLHQIDRLRLGFYKYIQAISDLKLYVHSEIEESKYTNTHHNLPCVIHNDKHELVGLSILSQSGKRERMVLSNEQKNELNAYIKHFGNITETIELNVNEDEECVKWLTRLGQCFSEYEKYAKLNNRYRQEYDIFLQIRQITEECHFTSIPKYQYLCQTNIYFNRNESISRLSRMKYRELPHPENIRFGLEFYDGVCLFAYQGVADEALSESSLNLRMDSTLQTTWLADGAASNGRIISWKNAKDKNKVNFNISRSIPFTRQLPDSSPIVTKDFFESNLELLSNKDYQTILMYNMFAPSILKKQLARNASFADDIIRFIEAALRHHSRDNELTEGGVFIYQLSYFMLKYFKSLPTNTNLSAAILHLESMGSSLNSEIESANRKDRKAIEIGLLKANFLRQSLDGETLLSIEQINRLLDGLFIFENTYTIIDIELRVATQRLIPLIRTSLMDLGSEQTTNLIKGILQKVLVPAVLPDLDQVSLVVNYPDVIVSDKFSGKTFRADLSLGKIESPQGIMIPTPPEFITDVYIKRLFGNKLVRVNKIQHQNMTTFEFDYNGNQYVITKSVASNNHHIYMKPKNESNWFEYIKNTKYNIDSFFCKNRFLEQDCSWWQSKSALEAEPIQYYCISRTHGNLLLSSKSNTESVLMCHLLSTNGDDTGYILLPYDSNSDNKLLYDPFMTFESINNIEVWQLTTGEPHFRVVLPRYNLTWDVKALHDNVFEYRLEKNPDFKLLLNYPNMIEAFPNMLYMKNEKTNEIVALVPKQEFYIFSLNDHDREYYHVKYDINNQFPSAVVSDLLGQDRGRLMWASPQQLIQLKVVNGELIGETVEDYLFIAFISLAAHDTNQAMRALHICQKLGGIQGTEEEVSLIMKIMRDIPNPDYNKDTPYVYSEARVNDPETLAVRLFAASLLIDQKRNSLNTPQFSLDPQEKQGKSVEITHEERYKDYCQARLAKFYTNEFAQCLIEAYRHYRKIQGNMAPEMQLSYFMRLSILSEMPTHSVATINELSTLRYIRDKEERKLYEKKKQKNDGSFTAEDQKILEELIQRIRQHKLAERKHSVMTVTQFDVKPLTEAELKTANKAPTFRPSNDNDNVMILPGTFFGPDMNIELFQQYFMDIYKAIRHDRQLALSFKDAIDNVLKMEREATRSNSIHSLSHILRYVIQFPEADWPVATSHYSSFHDADFLVLANQVCEQLYATSPILIDSDARSSIVEDITTEEQVRSELGVEFSYLPALLNDDSLSPRAGLFLGSLAGFAPFVNDIAAILSTVAAVELPMADSYTELQEKMNALEVKVGHEKNETRQKIIAVYVNYLSLPENRETLRRYFEPSSFDKGARESQLLEQANAAISGEMRTLDTHANVLGGYVRPIALKDLIWLYLQADEQLFMDRTKLEPDHVKQLYVAIHRYLLDCTTDDHRLRILQNINAPINEDTLIKLGDDLRLARNYAAADHPEILVFEYLEQLRVRKDQADILINLLRHEEAGYNNEIAQLIMGAGKSKVLLPLLALKKADGTNLSIVVLPSNLYAPGFADLRKKTEALLGKTGFPLLFDRDSNCQASVLKEMYAGLTDAMLNRDYIVTTSESMQSLQLKYLELLSRPFLFNKEKQQIVELEKILTFISTKGDAIIDECDTVLDSKRELNYTLGSANTVSDVIVNSILKLYRLLDRTDIGDKCSLGDVLRRNVVIATEAGWKAALNAYTTRLINDENSPLYFVSLFTPSDRREVESYLLGDASIIPTIMNGLDRAKQELISLARGEIDLLKTTLSRKPNEHYGFPTSEDFTGNRCIAIPYVSNNTPNERAQFGSIYETINYTIQLYKQKGVLPGELITRLINDYDVMAKEEINSNEQLNYNDTTAAAAFERLTNTSLADIKRLPFRDQQRIINHSVDAFDYILQNYILNTVEVYSQILRSNPINHVSQYRSAQGFTGTPWNVHCYHHRFHFNLLNNIGIDGQTIDLLIRKKSPVTFFDNQSPDETIKSILGQHGQIKAFLDIGAIFEGKSNLEIAILLAMHLRHGGLIKQILYFNSDNALCSLPIDSVTEDGKVKDAKRIIMIGSTDPTIIAEKTGLTPDERFTYYDQSHTTGIDILQAPDAIGIATIDIDTTSRDCWQGVMRLRQLAGRQSVQFALPTSVLAKKPDLMQSDWSIEHVIAFVSMNQTNKLAELHLRSSLDKMNDVVRLALLHKLYHSDTVDEKMALTSQFRDVFVSHVIDDPIKKFGPIESELDVLEILQDHSDSCLHLLKQHLGESIDESIMRSYSDLLEEIKIKAIRYCRERYKYSQSLENGMMLELQKSKESRKEKQNEKLVEKNLEKVSANPIGELTAVEYITWGRRLPFNLTVSDTSSPKIYSLNDLLGSTLGFSTNILVSENYKNTYLSQTNFLDDLIKPIDFFLLIKDERSNSLQALLITQVEADEFKENMDIIKASKPKGVDVWIISTHEAILHASADSIKCDHLLHREYQTILTQIQFFNGDINLYLKQNQFDWYFSGNPKEKEMFLTETVLKNYPEKKKFLIVFLDAVEEELSRRLKLVNIDISSPFQAVVDNDYEQIERYVHELRSLDRGLKEMAIHFHSRTDSGSLLPFAIRKGNEQAVKILLNSHDIVEAFRNTSDSPLLLMFESKNMNDNMLLLAVTRNELYPDASQTSVWTKIFEYAIEYPNPEIGKAIKSAACNNDATKPLLNDFINHRIHELIKDGFKKSPFAELSSLALLSDTPSRQVYEQYINQVFERASVSEIIDILNHLKETTLYDGFSDDLTRWIEQIARPDVMIAILENGLLGSKIDDLDTWLSVLDRSLGSYIQIDSVNTSTTSSAPPYHPIVKLDGDNLTRVITRYKDGQTKIHNCSKPSILTPGLISYHFKYLPHDDPLLNLILNNFSHYRDLTLTGEVYNEIIKRFDRIPTSILINNKTFISFTNHIVNNLFDSSGGIRDVYFKIWSDMLSKKLAPRIDNIAFWDGFFNKINTKTCTSLVQSRLFGLLVEFYPDIGTSEITDAHYIFVDKLIKLFGHNTNNHKHFKRLLAKINLIDPRFSCHIPTILSYLKYVSYSAYIDILNDIFQSSVDLSSLSHTDLIELYKVNKDNLRLKTFILSNSSLCLKIYHSPSLHDDLQFKFDILKQFSDFDFTLELNNSIPRLWEKAAEADDISIRRQLLERCGDTSATEFTGDVAKHLEAAIATDNVSCLKALVALQLTDNRITPEMFSIACKNSARHVIDYFPNRSLRPITPEIIRDLTEAGNLEFIKYLTTKFKYDFSLTLHIAVAAKKWDIVLYCIQNNAYISPEVRSVCQQNNAIPDDIYEGIVKACDASVFVRFVNPSRPMSDDIANRLNSSNILHSISAPLKTALINQNTKMIMHQLNQTEIDWSIVTKILSNDYAKPTLSLEQEKALFHKAAAANQPEVQYYILKNKGCSFECANQIKSNHGNIQTVRRHVRVIDDVRVLYEIGAIQTPEAYKDLFYAAVRFYPDYQYLAFLKYLSQIYQSSPLAATSLFASHGEDSTYLSPLVVNRSPDAVPILIELGYQFTPDIVESMMRLKWPATPNEVPLTTIINNVSSVDELIALFKPLIDKKVISLDMFDKVTSCDAQRLSVLKKALQTKDDLSPREHLSLFHHDRTNPASSTTAPTPNSDPLKKGHD